MKNVNYGLETELKNKVNNKTNETEAYSTKHPKERRTDRLL